MYVEAEVFLNRYLLHTSSRHYVGAVATKANKT